MTRRLIWLVVLGIGICVRLIGLGREPFWTDEMHTIVHAGVPFASRTHVWTLAHLREITQGPLFMLIVNAWSRLCGGGSEFSLRLVPLVFGIAAIPTIHAQARAWLGDKVGWWVALLLALSPFHVWYARELRGYTLVILAAIAASWLWHACLQRMRDGRPVRVLLVGYLATVAIGLGASFTMAFMPLVHAAWWLGSGVRSRRMVLLAALPVLGATVLLGWPWIEAVAQRLDWSRLIDWSGGHDALRTGASFSPGAIPYTLFAFSAGFSFGPPVDVLRHDSQQALRAFLPAALLIFGVFGVPAVAGGVALWRGDRRALWQALAWLAIPFAATAFLAVFEIKPWNARYVAICLPAYLALVARGLVALPVRTRAVLAAGIVGVSSLALARLHLEPEYWKEDYRAAGAAIAAAWQPGDVLVGEGAPDPVLYYVAIDPVAYLHVQSYRVSEPELWRRLDRVADGAPRVWWLRARAWQSDPAPVRKYLLRNWQPTVSYPLRGARLERWE